MWDVQGLEAHWLGCMASAAGGGKVTRLAGATVLANPVSEITMLNCILLRNVSPERLEGLLDVGRVLLAAYERPPALFLSPASGDMEALADKLTALGWRAVLRQRVLVRRLDRELPEPPAEPRVVETDDLDRWGRLLVEAYEVPPKLGGSLRAAWAGLEGGYHYLAYLSGRPVGTGLTWMQGPIAGLYAGAVLPAWRRRGVERASLLQRMADAARRGALLAALQTEAGSLVEHLCRQRLGFDQAYERLLWMDARLAARTSTE